MEKIEGALDTISKPLNILTGQEYRHRHILLLIIPGTQIFSKERVYLLFNSREWKTHVVYGIDLLEICKTLESPYLKGEDIVDIDNFLKDNKVKETIYEDIRHNFRLPDGSFELRDLKWKFIRVKYSPRWKKECVYIHFGYQLIIFDDKFTNSFRKRRPYNGKFKWYTYNAMKKEINMMYRASDLISYLFAEERRLDLWIISKLVIVK